MAEEVDASAVEPRVIKEITNPEIVLDPLGQLPFKAAEMPELSVEEEPVVPPEYIETPAAEVTGVISKPVRRTKSRQNISAPDPDRYLMGAKAAVVENYNAHRDGRRSPELTMETVYISSFTKTLGHWKAIVESPIVRGLLWIVTNNGQRKELYVDVYKKINNVKVENESS